MKRDTNIIVQIMGLPNKQNNKKCVAGHANHKDTLKLYSSSVNHTPKSNENDVLSIWTHKNVKCKDPQSMPLVKEIQNTYCHIKKLRIIVARQDYSKMVAFVMKRTDPMEKLIKRYSLLFGVQASCLRFLFDGYKINDPDTPNTLQMKDNDIIEVYKLAFNGGKCQFKLLSEK